MGFVRRTLALTLALALAGCSQLPVQEQVQGNPALWQAHKAQVSPLNSWQITGKLGVKAKRAEKTESGSATLMWLQHPAHYDIRLSGPLGRGATRLVGTPGAVELTVSGQGVFHAPSAEALLQEQLGWYVPVDQLLWWARGLPAPSQRSQLTLGADGRLTSLIQQQWRVDYLSYSQQGPYWLPERLKLSGPNLELTLVIKEWQARTLDQ